MSADFGIVYPLWSHHLGDGSLLERVVGEAAIQHVTIPVVTGPREVFRPYWFSETPYFHTPGGWHFPPKPRLYSASSVRPRAAKWFGGRDVLAEVVEAARGFGLKVCFEIDLPACDVVWAEYETITRRSAWGQERQPPRACVCNPHFRECLRAVLEDLRQFDPAGHLLCGLLDPDGEPRSPASGPSYAAETAVCLCASCREIAAAADLDPDVAARHVRECVLAHPDSVAAGEFPRTLDGARTVVSRYRSARVRDGSAWLARLAADHSVWLLADSPEAQSVAAIADPAPGAPPIVWTVFPRESSAASESNSPAARPNRGIRRSLWRADEGRHYTRLVERIAEEVRAGVAFFDFADLDAVQTGALTWLKQAVRYAARE